MTILFKPLFVNVEATENSSLMMLDKELRWKYPAGQSEWQGGLPENPKSLFR